MIRRYYFYHIKNKITRFTATGICSTYSFFENPPIAFDLAIEQACEELSCEPGVLGDVVFYRV